MTQKSTAANQSNPWTMDVRVRERNLKSGALTEKDLEKYLAALPDVEGQSESFSTPQPALAQPPQVHLPPQHAASGMDDLDDGVDDEMDDESSDDVNGSAAAAAPIAAQYAEPDPVREAHHYEPQPQPEPVPAVVHHHQEPEPVHHQELGGYDNSAYAAPEPAAVEPPPPPPVPEEPAAAAPAGTSDEQIDAAFGDDEPAAGDGEVAAEPQAPAAAPEGEGEPQ